jgi:hypothetical protein
LALHQAAIAAAAVASAPIVLMATIAQSAVVGSDTEVTI